MAIAATFDGYVVCDPELQDGEYGRQIHIILKVSLGGREVHFVEARFFGRKIALIQDYVKAGDYMTMTGAVSRIVQRQRRDGIKCCHLYLRDAFITLPPKMGAAPALNTDPSKAYSLEEPIDRAPSPDDDVLSI